MADAQRFIRNALHSLLRRYNEIVNQRAVETTGHGALMEPPVKPVFPTPGEELSKEDLRQAEAYLRSQPGVVVKEADADDDGLCEPLMTPPWTGRSAVR